jgi:hypothetical protein
MQISFTIFPIKHLHIFSLHPPISAACRQAIPHAADHDTGYPDLQNAFDIALDISFPF